MSASIRNFLQAPVFDDPEKNIQAQNLSIILRGLVVLTLLFLIYTFFYPPIGQVLIALGALVFEFGLLLLLKNRQLQVVGTLFVTFLWAAILTEVILYGGIRDSGYASFALLIVVAALTLGARAGIFYTILSIAAGAVLAFAETHGWLPQYTHSPIGSVLTSYVITFTCSVLLINLAIRGITMLARRALANEHAQKEINIQLEASRAELQAHTIALEQRNITLQTVAEVPSLTNQSKNEKELLEQSARLLASRLNLDRVDIYLLSQLEENAILRASNTSKGNSLITQGYQLKAINSDIQTTLLGSDVLRYQIGDRYYTIEHPEPLPDTNINLSLPLISGGHLLGLINIQSTALEPNRIDQQALQTFSDQLALSIENVRLLVELQSRVREVSLLAGQTIQTSWEQIRSGKSIGYNFDQVQVLPATESFPADITAKLSNVKSVSYVTTENPARIRLIAPIILRESVIGAIGYEDNDVNHEWQENERTLLEVIASRLSLTLENTRLVSEAQQRAERERNLGQATARMRETLDIDTVLRTAVQEIKRTFKLDQAEVRLKLADTQEQTDLTR